MSIEDSMMMLRDCELKPGATDDEIGRLEIWAKTSLPKSYLDVLKRTNGAEGPVGDSGYLQLWTTEDVPRDTEDYEVAEYAPGFMLIGSSGGGSAFAIDIGNPSLGFYRIPFIGMSRESAKFMGSNFEDFLRSLGSED